MIPRYYNATVLKSYRNATSLALGVEKPGYLHVSKMKPKEEFVVNASDILNLKDVIPVRILKIKQKEVEAGVQAAVWKRTHTQTHRRTDTQTQTHTHTDTQTQTHTDAHTHTHHARAFGLTLTDCSAPHSNNLKYIYIYPNMHLQAHAITPKHTHIHA